MSTPEEKPELLPAPRPGGARSFMIPTTVAEAMKLAEFLARSAFVPKDFRGKPEDVFCAIGMGADVGLAPLPALQSIAVINGRPSVWGDGALAIVLASGTVEDFREWVEGDGEAMIAHCLGKRKGRSSPVAYAFAVSDAKKARLWGKEGPWQTNPKRMLQMRARGFVLRDGWSDYLKGLSIREETEDYEPLPEEHREERPAIEMPRRLGEAPKLAEVPAAPAPVAVPHTRGGTCLACHPHGGGTCRLEPPSSAPDPSLPPDPAETELAALAAEPELPLSGNGPGKLPPPEVMLTETERKELLRLCNKHSRSYPDLRKWLEAHGVASSLAIPARLKAAVTAWVEGRAAAAELAAASVREPGTEG